MATVKTGSVRRRRRPEEAEREILDAAEELLREARFSALTVDELMSRTGLSRASFYVYFRDRHHLIMRLTERIGGGLFGVSERRAPGSGGRGGGARGLAPRKRRCGGGRARGRRGCGGRLCGARPGAASDR